jgi:hypothetical protein
MSKLACTWPEADGGANVTQERIADALEEQNRLRKLSLRAYRESSEHLRWDLQGIQEEIGSLRAQVKTYLDIKTGDWSSEGTEFRGTDDETESADSEIDAEFDVENGVEIIEVLDSSEAGRPRKTEKRTEGDKNDEETVKATL